MPLEIERKRVVDDIDAARNRLEGPTRENAGYKVRDEISAKTGDPVELAAILDQLEYDVIAEIDRPDA